MKPMIDVPVISMWRKPPPIKSALKGKKHGKYIYTDEELKVEAKQFEDSSKIYRAAL